MTPEEFIKTTIHQGDSSGLATLDPDQRFVFLISEAEAWCDMDGIDTLLDRYSPAELAECASAFAEVGASRIATELGQIVSALPHRDEMTLSNTDALIKDRVGYDFETIRAAVATSAAASTSASSSTR